MPSPFPKSYLKFLHATAALSVPCRKSESGLFLFSLSHFILMTMHSLTQIYLLSFQIVCLNIEEKKRARKKSDSPVSFYIDFRPFIYNTFSYLYLALLPSPNIYVIERLWYTGKDQSFGERQKWFWTWLFHLLSYVTLNKILSGFHPMFFILLVRKFTLWSL